MKVFILAAGFGKRLRPFTEKLPKPLIKIKHKPLIDWNLYKRQIILMKKKSKELAEL